MPSSACRNRRWLRSRTGGSETSRALPRARLPWSPWPPRGPLRESAHLRAEEAHELAAFDTELLGHGHDQRIALLRAHHGEPDAGVAARCLDDGLSGFELPRLLGRFDDTERQAILHGTQGIEGLDLGKKVHAGGRQPI